MNSLSRGLAMLFTVITLLLINTELATATAESDAELNCSIVTVYSHTVFSETYGELRRHKIHSIAQCLSLVEKVGHWLMENRPPMTSWITLEMRYRVDEAYLHGQENRISRRPIAVGKILLRTDSKIGLSKNLENERK